MAVDYKTVKQRRKYKWYEKGEGISAEDFTTLYSDGFNRTCELFYKMGYPPEDCEELAQEVYLLLWRTRKDLVGSPVSFWLLKFYKICADIKAGRFSNPIDSLVAVRNSDREDLLTPMVAPDESPEFVTDDMLKTLPPLVQEYFRAVLAGYTVRECQVLMCNRGIFLKIRKILEQPEVKRKLLEYLRD